MKTNPDDSLIKVKTADYTVQNVVSIFNATLERVPNCPLTIAGTDEALTWFAFRDKKSGLDMVTLWDGTEIPSTASDIETVQRSIKGGRFKQPVWLDLITGNIYEIPPAPMTVQGETVAFKDVPVYDGPAVITDNCLLTFEPAREKKKPARSAPAVPPTQEVSVVAPKIASQLLPGTQQPAPAVCLFPPRPQLDGR